MTIYAYDSAVNTESKRYPIVLPHHMVSGLVSVPRTASSQCASPCCPPYMWLQSMPVSARSGCSVIYIFLLQESLLLVMPCLVVKVFPLTRCAEKSPWLTQGNPVSNGLGEECRWQSRRQVNQITLQE